MRFLAKILSNNEVIEEDIKYESGAKEDLSLNKIIDEIISKHNITTPEVVDITIHFKNTRAQNCALLQQKVEGCITFTEDNKETIIKKCDIMYCLVNGNDRHVFRKGSDFFITSKTTEELEKLLAGLHFMRVNKGVIVNKYFIDSVKPVKRGLELKMEDAVVLTVSVRKKDAFDSWHK